MPEPETALPAEGDYTLVRYTDGRQELAPARIGDVVAFELERGRPPSTSSIADVMWLVWRALGQPEGDLQTWVDTVATIASDAESIEQAKGELPLPPTETAPAGDG